MVKTSVARDIRFARDIDETDLRQLEKIFLALNPDGFSIEVIFSNGFAVKCHSVNEMIDIPMLSVQTISGIRLYSRPNTFDKAGSGKYPTEARIHISNKLVSKSITYDISGEYETVVNAKHTLDIIFERTLSRLRSVLYLHPYVDPFFIGIITYILFFNTYNLDIKK